MRKHTASHIIAVTARKRQFVTCSKLAGTCIHTCSTTNASHTKAVKVVSSYTLLVTRSIVHTTNHAVAKPSQFKVVKLQPIDVVVAIHVVVTAHTEAHRAKQIAHLRVVRVTLGTNDSRNRLRGIIIVIELRLGKSEVRVVKAQAVGRSLCPSTRSHEQGSCCKFYTFCHVVNWFMSHNPRTFMVKNLCNDL